MFPYRVSSGFLMQVILQAVKSCLVQMHFSFSAVFVSDRFKKSFIRLRPSVNVINIFYVSNEKPIKLDGLSLTSFYIQMRFSLLGLIISDRFLKVL
jgi:hypothetical protein